MKKKPSLNDQRPVSRPLSGRFTPREASPRSKVPAKKAPPKKTRYVTPNPFSPRGSGRFSREGTLSRGHTLGTRGLIDRAGRLGVGFGLGREKSPRKLVALGGDAGSKITSIINSPRNSELRYANALATKYRSSDASKMGRKVAPTGVPMAETGGKIAGKENESLKKIRE